MDDLVKPMDNCGMYDGDKEWDAVTVEKNANKQEQSVNQSLMESTKPHDTTNAQNAVKPIK